MRKMVGVSRVTYVGERTVCDAGTRTQRQAAAAVEWKIVQVI